MARHFANIRDLERAIHAAERAPEAPQPLEGTIPAGSTLYKLFQCDSPAVYNWWFLIAPTVVASQADNAGSYQILHEHGAVVGDLVWFQGTHPTSETLDQWIMVVRDASSGAVDLSNAAHYGTVNAD